MQSHYRGLPIEGLEYVAGLIQNWRDNSVKRAKLRRQVATPPIDKQGCMAARWITTLYPWTIYNYPGYTLMLAQICGVGRDSVKDWLYKRRQMPWYRAERLLQHVRSRIASEQAIERELERYVAERRRAVPVRGRPFVKHQRSADRAAD